MAAAETELAASRGEVPADGDWDDHVEQLLSAALGSWRAGRDSRTLLELLGAVVAAIGRRVDLR
jgi:hypothetical protein